jgi:hypothetical protein
MSGTIFFELSELSAGEADGIAWVSILRTGNTSGSASWSRSFGQNFCLDQWIVCRG